MGSIPAATTVWLAEPSQTTNGIKVLAAAYVALNHGGEGSSPSDPTKQQTACQDVGKSGIPRGPEPRDRRFKSDRPDLHDAVVSVLVRTRGC